MHGLEDDVATAYTEFAVRQARGYCPAYERLALGVADDAELVGWLETLPRPGRQPNLLFGATRFLGGPVEDWAEFRGWLGEHRDAVERELTTRATQTNEAGRCATLLPWLALVPGPVALVEVGCSAGLCLYPDRYAYRYATRAGDVVVGAGTPELPCVVEPGIALPGRLPQVVWRGGLDLNPLDAGDPDTIAWLRALIWPGQPERERRRPADRSGAPARRGAGRRHADRLPQRGAGLPARARTGGVLADDG